MHCCYNKLVCPLDKGYLSSNLVDSERGTFVCNTCGREYHMMNGIIRLLPPDTHNSLDDVELDAIQAEQTKRDIEAEFGIYDSVMGSRFMFHTEVLPLIDLIMPVRGECVVDLGCGTGRATLELAQRGANVIAVDLSLKSLLVAKHKLERASLTSVCLIQGDVSKIPIATSSSPKILSTQV